MKKQLREKDFYQIKSASFNRLLPDRISVFFWGALVYSFVMTLFTINGFSSPNITNPFWSLIILISMVALLGQFLVTVFYAREKMAYKFQRAQVIILCIITFKMSFEMYQVFFLLHADRWAPSYLADMGIGFMIGGFLLFILSVVRSLKVAEKGELSQTGKGLYHFKESKGFFSLPIIFGITIIVGVIARSASGVSGAASTSIELYIALFLSIVIQYAIALVWPEFFLLALCKYKFKSFNQQVLKR